MYEKACPLFVPIIENGYLDENNIIVKSVVSEYLSEYKNLELSSIILECTHYPLLKNAIIDFLPGIKIIEAGKEAALQFSKILSEKQLCAEETKVGKHFYYVSEKTDTFNSICSLFLGENIDQDNIFVNLLS